jgi:hypothetical protein
MDGVLSCATAVVTTQLPEWAFSLAIGLGFLLAQRTRPVFSAKKKLVQV